MKFFRSKRDALLDQAISELRAEQPDSKALSASAERVWQRLQEAAGETISPPALQLIRGCADIRALLPAFYKRELSPARALLVEDHLRECVSCRSYAHGRNFEGGSAVDWRMETIARGFQWNFGKWSLAAAALLLVAVLAWTGRDWYVAGPPGSRARIESLQGLAYRVNAAGDHVLNSGDELAQGELVRTPAHSHATMRLFDGSELELNQRVELAVSANRRNTTIHLNKGSIIVQAAKRRTGHLYVSAPDCTVAVTGTVFSVNSGTKGSRVTVIEGEVHVEHDGTDSVLHPGDELATTQSVGTVPVSEEIGWTQNLALLAEFSKLREKFSEIPAPAPRYQSQILPLLPSDTVLYIGIPNLGDALEQANQIFQQELSQSEVLQQWWSKIVQSNQGPTPEQLIAEIRTLSQYLGDEVVITVPGDSASSDAGPILLAEVRQAGLKDYLQNHLTDTLRNSHGTSDVHVVDPQTLSTLSADQKGMIMLVRQNMLIVGGDAASVGRMNAQIDSGTKLFPGTDFGQRILNVYSHGAEIVFALNFAQILESSEQKSASASSGESKALQNSGFSDLKYIVATRSEGPGQGDNRITLEFTGQRHGIASWLAAPAPMGSLDYVSANAGVAVSFVAKQPALMLDDLFSTIGASDPNFSQSLDRANAELGLDIRNDLASALGGEMTLALDGPVLPTPSWKMVIEVNDSGALQLAIEKLVQALNREAEKSNQPGVTLDQTQVGGRTFYTIHSQVAALSTEYDYTFADGYLLVAPSRALLLSALQTHANGTSLALSASFRSLLPSDNQANFSAMVYQNLSPILKPLSSQITPRELALLQQLAADAKPSVICAYGESDRIQVASNGRLFDFNPGFLALSHLLEQAGKGTSPQAHP
jgi:hypothetical protein